MSESGSAFGLENHDLMFIQTEEEKSTLFISMAFKRRLQLISLETKKNSSNVFSKEIDIEIESDRDRNRE